VSMIAIYSYYYFRMCFIKERIKKIKKKETQIVEVNNYKEEPGLIIKNEVDSNRETRLVLNNDIKQRQLTVIMKFVENAESKEEVKDALELMLKFEENELKKERINASSDSVDYNKEKDEEKKKEKERDRDYEYVYNICKYVFLVFLCTYTIFSIRMFSSNSWINKLQHVLFGYNGWFNMVPFFGVGSGLIMLSYLQVGVQMLLFFSAMALLFFSNDELLIQICVHLLKGALIALILIIIDVLFYF